MENKSIIPIASGKGGVGKSFFTASLGIALARRGEETVVVDLDLGGSNLHLYLGLANDFPGVGDYLVARSAPLDAMMVSTAQENLRFIPGDGKTPGMASINYAQKKRLIGDLERLPGRYILLDLGSGSGAHNLDFYAMSDSGILLLTPDFPSIMNGLTFLKNHLFRLLERQFKNRTEAAEALRVFKKTPLRENSHTVKEVIESIAFLDPLWAEEIGQIRESCHPRIVFNRGEHPSQAGLTTPLAKSLSRLGIEADFFAFLFEDPLVRKALYGKEVYQLHHEGSPFAEGITEVADRVLRLWDRRIEGSEKRLRDNADAFFLRHLSPVSSKREGKGEPSAKESPYSCP